MAGRQAKIVDDKALPVLLEAVEHHRYPHRDRVIILLSFKAGLRAMEIAKLRRHMVMDASGWVGDSIHLEDGISKKGSGRIIPMHPDLQVAIRELFRKVPGQPADPLILSERCFRDDADSIADKTCMEAKSIGYFFYRLYRKCNLIGCSSHSGRRTFITKSARKITQAGGSLRDVQQLAGHRSIATTERYIEVDNKAARRLMKLI